jgi:uncharacterized protein (DUF1501 family)
MQAADYSTFNRRHFLKHLAGLSMMALPGLGFVRTLRAAAPTLKKENKSIIILWMSGGPSHLDIWDLKPEATDQVRGQFKPMKTAVSGVQICEHMKQTAKQMQHLSIVRSLATNEGSHERGRVLMHTARQPNPSINFPSFGAVASQQLTDKNLALPGFIAVGRPADGPGFLGMNYAPFTVQNPGQPPANIKAPADALNNDELRVHRRQQLFYALEDDFEKRGEAAKAHKEIYAKAFSLVASPQGKVFDLRNEKTSLLAEYGDNAFGRGCLLARKLVESGVTCVEVDLGGWDNHAGIFPTLRNERLPTLDKGMATLVRDLVDRGMWKNTVVVWMGEFGRTPRINQNGGRDHWARCWSVVLGGGAIKAGQVIGSTTKDGMDVQDGRVTVGDLFATLYKGMGIDPGLQIRDTIGRPHNISGESGKPISGLV